MHTHTRTHCFQSQDGSSKEGAGRVALFRDTGLTHLYTIEANYNTARVLNIVPPASGKHNGRASPPNMRRASPRFTAEVLQAGGRAFLVSDHVCVRMCVYMCVCLCVCVCVCVCVWFTAEVLQAGGRAFLVSDHVCV